MSAVAEQLGRDPTLDQLLAGIAPAPLLPVPDITLDSRRVSAGAVFFACRGTSAHGLDYLDTAVGRGAAAVVWEPGERIAPPVRGDVILIPVPDLRSRLGTIAHRFFGDPSERLGITGVTGTNGKTSVAWILTETLNRLGRNCAYLGTLGRGRPGALEESALTTPDVIELHRQLARFVAEGASHAALEVSSHALDQGRTDAVRMQGAVFTNLSRDHLDYHGDMQRYGQAKAKLFEAAGLGQRIINVDDEFGAELALRHPQTTLGVTRRARRGDGRVLRVTSAGLTSRGVHFRFTAPHGQAEVRSGLHGAFNVENLALVLGVLLEAGVGAEEAAEALGEAAAPPGRMQKVGDGEPLVIVDYAHTPAALESAIDALRPHCRGRLWCVFGCGGDRDRGKRPLMGRTASAADRIVVTSDNPRGEDPRVIIREIVAGMAAPDEALLIEDRAEAIAAAISEAADEDCILIAGKGHERHQITAEGRRRFDDSAVAAQALARRCS